MDLDNGWMNFFTKGLASGAVNGFSATFCWETWDQLSKFYTSARGIGKMLKT